MESKNKFWKGVLVGALVTAFIGLIIVGFSAGIFLIGKSMIQNQRVAQSVEVETDSDSLNFDKIQMKVNMIQQLIEKYYLFEEDAEKVEDGIYSGLMYGLEDPYSVYYNEDAFSRLQESTEGIYCGIGVMVSQDRSSGIISVVKVFPGTPGFEAGMLPGDKIYMVEGEEVSGIDLDLVVSQHIKGEEGTEVTITVYRQEEDKYVDLTMKRQQIEVPTVETRMLDGNIGVISVSQFDVITAEQFKSAIEDLESQGMKKMVVDLRNNPGGVLDSVVEMLDYVLPDGLLVYTADKNGQGEQFYSEDGHQVDMPMVVLVNGNSASASEVFAGAIRDFEWGKLVGTTTFGKGIVQNLIPLGDGTAVKMTVAHYFTPSGFDLHGKGLEPDVEVELTEGLQSKAVIEPEEDNQLQEALKVLETMNK